MTDIRMLVSWGAANGEERDRYSNTLYFAHADPGEPDYQDLANDLRDIYAGQSWTAGTMLEVRAYNMADAKPRPERAFSSVQVGNTPKDGPGQVALCLSYYSERNLPRQRGRIYTGPYTNPALRPTSTHQAALLTFAQALGDLGGVNVDWSVYSPTKATAGQDPTMSISDVWVDNSWDVQRRRKLDATNRVTATISE